MYSRSLLPVLRSEAIRGCKFPGSLKRLYWVDHGGATKALLDLYSYCTSLGLPHRQDTSASQGSPEPKGSRAPPSRQRPAVHTARREVALPGPTEHQPSETRPPATPHRWVPLVNWPIARPKPREGQPRPPDCETRSRQLSLLGLRFVRGQLGIPPRSSACRQRKREAGDGAPKL